ncbi:MAG: hypothetical protein Q4P66_06970 [Actinomycetaceae bacterium]|nr:hypothetical protein [Actinomycetaceae bacterium]
MKTSKGVVKTSVVVASVIAAFVGAAPFASADSEAGNPGTTTGASVEVNESTTGGAALAIDDEHVQNSVAIKESEEPVNDVIEAPVEEAHEVSAPAAVNSTSVRGNNGSTRSANAIDTNNMEAVRAAYLKGYAENDVQTLASTNADALHCVPGEVNPQTADMVIGTWNFFRGLNNLDAVHVDPASPLSKYIQKAALTQAAQYKSGKGGFGLSHHPRSQGFKCADAEADTGASHSNLAQANGFTPAEQIQWWYQDWSGTNVSTMTGEGSNDRLGHRAWLMDPYVTESAYGNVDGFNALAVATGAGYGDYDSSRMKNPNATAPETMSWPSAGYFPAELLTSIAGTTMDSNDVERWSFRVRGADMSNAKVSVTGPRGAVKVRVVKPGMKYAPGSTSGYGTVLFKMENKDVYAPASTGVNTYTVRVSGVKNAPQSSYYYQVKLFNADVTNTHQKPRLIVSREPLALQGTTAAPARVRAIGKDMKFQWQRSKDQGRTWENVAVDKKLATTPSMGQPTQLSWSPNTKLCDNATYAGRQSCPLTYSETQNYRFRLRATNAAGATYTPAMKATYLGFKDMPSSVNHGQTVKGELAFDGNGDWVTISPDIHWYANGRAMKVKGTHLGTSQLSSQKVEARVSVTVWTMNGAMRFFLKSPSVTIR